MGCKISSPLERIPTACTHPKMPPAGRLSVCRQTSNVKLPRTGLQGRPDHRSSAGSAFPAHADYFRWTNQADESLLLRLASEPPRIKTTGRAAISAKRGVTEGFRPLDWSIGSN